MTGEVVILKFVDLDGFALHSFLSSLKAPHNTRFLSLTAPHLGIEKLIVMQQEQVLRDILDSELRTTGHFNSAEEFSSFMIHAQKVEHLHLKPDNTVVTTTTHPQRLSIIDFSVSVESEGIKGREGGWLQSSKMIWVQSISQFGPTSGLRGGYCATLLSVLTCTVGNPPAPEVMRVRTAMTNKDANSCSTIVRPE